MARRSTLRIAYSPTFKKQGVFGTPLSNSELTAVLTARVGTQEHVEVAETIEDVFDCTGQYKVDDIVLHRIATLTIDLEGDAQTVMGFLALWGGATGAPSGAGPYVHTVNMLGPTVFDLPVTTMIVGFAEGSDPGVIFQDVACNRITFTGRIGENLRVRIELVGNGALPSATSFTFPDCTQPNPLRFTTGSSFLLNSVEKLNIAGIRDFELVLDNNMPLNDYPFIFSDVDVKRLARGDRRPCFMRPSILGIVTDALGVAVRAVPKNHWPFTLKIGSSTTYVQIAAADNIVRPRRPLTAWDGEVAESKLQIELEPDRIPGNAATPLVFTASLSQAGAFLTTGT
jgi:hypothetical protein